MVERAHLEGVMGLEIAEFRTSPENPIDAKAAVINALSWRFEGKSSAELYAYYLALLYHVSVTELDTEFLSADEVFLHRLFNGMDVHHYRRRALPLLEEAHKVMKDSLRFRLFWLLQEDKRLSDFRLVWGVRLTEEVLKLKNSNRIYALRLRKWL